jgi:amino acid adenylation domain-containing protein
MSESLTPAQRRLFTQHLLHPGDASYNLAFLFRLGGSVDLDRLISAGKRLLREVVSLSMYYAAPDGSHPARIIHDPDFNHEVQVFPLPPGGEDELVAEVSRAADTPIPPDRPPLITTRVHTGPDSVYVTLLISHLISDAYTFYAFSRRLGELYDDPEGPIPGAELTPNATTAEQRDGTTAIAYFRKRVRGRALCPSRFEGIRDRNGSIPGSRVVADLGPSDRYAAWASRHGVTMASLFLAVHVLLEQALTGERTVAVGIPQAGRRGREQREAFGCFVNTLPLVVEPARHPDLVSLCRALDVELTSLVRYQLFDLTANAAEVLDGGGGTTFGSTFTYYREPLTLRIGGVPVVSLPLHRRQISYPLTLNVEHGPDRVLGHLEYADELAPAQPERLLRTLLDQVVSDDCPRPAEIRAVSAAHERELIALCRGSLDAPRDTGRGLAHHQTVTGAVIAAAAAHLDRVAITDHEGSWTYSTLIEQARQRAGIIARDVPGRHVIVALRPGREAVATILGVGLAGKTYVPVEPDCPPQRLELLREDIGDAPVISEDSSLAKAIASAPASAAAIDGAEPPLPRPEDHAYVIFTSGSTGRPKGVQVTQRNVVRLFVACDQRMAFEPTDSWALFHSLAFDLSVWEIFGALLHGARLVIVPPVVRRDPTAFADFLIRERVTVLTHTPSALRRLLGVLSPEQARNLRIRHVVLGGEPLHPGMLRRWYELVGDRAEIANMYGITETTVHVTHHVVSRTELDEKGPANVGRPLPEWDIKLVDAWGRPCPVGTPGEIVVGGAGVSDGYVARPELTAERFRVDPVDGSRHYRSGDLGVLRPSGELVHLGRIDRQIQLRGYRIEPGEIESVLCRVPGVREAVVVCDDRPMIEPRLVAFLTGDTDGIPSEDSLRQMMRRCLPSHMVPAVMIHLDRIPLTVNGKTDFKALPLPQLHPQPPRQRVAASTLDSDRDDEILRMVAGAWCEVLAVPEVKPNHNFFDIGGTSMHLVELHRRLTERFDADLEITELFEYPTVRALADRLRGVSMR